ncbi:FMN reductase [Burkholderia ubonensis]|uniref:FMN reductase n=1 Tax=Burkholderia ubonensis TaxID=101571 RepID=A0AB73G821_9BURK|nr:NAD(P)H-dependent oxidoreductase [Burkholderia ubonensis]KVC86900.1 FMN reductase [Burkholderia ubonensis]KVK86462.1 FMN reductase [Burkholderia ubonensis]KVL71208.1 FMN reductase [Burkholderia ubonensis]KVM35889.1 FMN reductase [Burkholderia ubonensis]KVM39961.1 FMN reductase [Burkholderia ubonensis]
MTDSEQCSRRPLVVGIGGTGRAASSTAHALALALSFAQSTGASIRHVSGAFLYELPFYKPELKSRYEIQKAFVEIVRNSNAIIIASPAYHGGMSGVVKNALDTLEDLRTDGRPYLDGRAVGCIVTSQGSQAGGATLAAMRSTVHALRGWPTPLGVVVNTQEAPCFDAAGNCIDDKVFEQLRTLGQQVVTFARAFGEFDARDRGPLPSAAMARS